MFQASHQKKENSMELINVWRNSKDFNWESTGLLKGLEKESHRTVGALFDWVMMNCPNNYQLILPIIRRIFSRISDEITNRLKSEPTYIESKYDFIIRYGEISNLSSKIICHLIDLEKLVDDFNNCVDTINHLENNFPNLDAEMEFCRIFSENQSAPILEKLKLGIEPLAKEVIRVEKIDQITNGLE